MTISQVRAELASQRIEEQAQTSPELQEDSLSQPRKLVAYSLK